MIAKERMDTVPVIVVVDLSVDPQERYTKTFKRLNGCQLERLIEVPGPVLVPGNLLELTLDGQLRELRIDAVRWTETKQMLRVRTLPTEALAEVLEGQGIRSWAPWKARRSATEFVDRCRAAGWRLASSPQEPLPPRPPGERAVDRREPTL